jgi:hypothetical protein
MADTSKASLSWPSGSWKILTKIIRAWYTAENGGGEWTQKTVARLAAMQPSRVSVNKAFLQDIGIVQAEGISLTEAGESLGFGLYNDNPRLAQQALQKIVRENSILKQLLDIIRGRGTVDRENFEDEVLLLTKQGKDDAPGFTIGVRVLEDILVESGLVEESNDAFRPTKAEFRDELPTPKKEEEYRQNESKKVGLRQIPIPVSASIIWYIDVSENPEPGEIEKFIEMQKLIFGVTKPS